MSRKESRRSWRRAGSVAWAVAGLAFLAGRGSAGAWSLEDPVPVMEGGSFIGTALPVSYEEVEDTLAWFAPDPIEELNLCVSEFVFCSIQGNDILFFAFEVAPGSALVTGDGLGANLTGSLSDGGWLIEMPTIPARSTRAARCSAASARFSRSTTTCPDRATELRSCWGASNSARSRASSRSQVTRQRSA